MTKREKAFYDYRQAVKTNDKKKQIEALDRMFANRYKNDK